MPDITMCSGEGCPMKFNCYRAQARPSIMQSWFSEVPLKDNGDCPEFIELRKQGHSQDTAQEKP